MINKRNLLIVFVCFCFAFILHSCNKTPKELYEVVWKNDNGIVLKTDKVKEGTLPSYDGKTPSKDATDDIFYTFNCWIPAIKPVDGNQEYTASFTEVNLYSYNVIDDEVHLVEVNKKDIKTLNVPTSINDIIVTRILEGCFAGLDQVEEIVLPDSIVLIEEFAFRGLSSLKKITMPFIGSSRTAENESASFGYLFGTDAYERSYEGNGYYFPTSLKEIIITDAYSITSNAFEGCSSITNIEIPISVTTIGISAFRNCNNLKSITLPFVGQSRTSTGVFAYFNYIFGGFNLSIPASLKKVFITDASKIGDSAFSGCSNLMSVAIPDTVASIGDLAFASCSSLLSVKIPSSVVSIGDKAFVDCKSLSSIVVDSDNNIYDSRNNCNAIIITETNTLIFGCIFTVIYDSVTSIESSAFQGCAGLLMMSIPNSVTSIGSSAFRGCSNLLNIKIPNSITAIEDSTFYNCSSLKSVEIPDSVLSIADLAFFGCISLTNIEIPDSVTSMGAYTFSGCISLTRITLPFVGQSRDATGTLAYFNYIFEGTFIGTSLAIKEAIITDAYKIDDGAFMGCLTLKSVEILNGVEQLGDSAFSGCINLTSIEIPNSVTTIGNSAFFNCKNLTKIEIPDSVISIGYWAFSGCNKLTIYCEADNKPSGWHNNWNNEDRPVIWGYEK